MFAINYILENLCTVFMELYLGVSSDAILHAVEVSKISLRRYYNRARSPVRLFVYLFLEWGLPLCPCAGYCFVFVCFMIDVFKMYDCEAPYVLFYLKRVLAEARLVLVLCQE